MRDKYKKQQSETQKKANEYDKSFYQRNGHYESDIPDKINSYNHVDEKQMLEDAIEAGIILPEETNQEWPKWRIEHAVKVHEMVNTERGAFLKKFIPRYRD